MKEAQYTKQELQAARTILSYLSKHPSSSDTLQGIATWWLKQERFDYTKKQIRQALTFLVGKGLMIVKKYNQQNEYYQAGPEQAAQINIALEQLTATVNEADNLSGLDKKKMLAPRAFMAWERGEREILSGRFYKMATWLVGLNWLLALLKLNFALKW
jgi:hypothetical protein